MICRYFTIAFLINQPLVNIFRPILLCSTIPRILRPKAKLFLFIITTVFGVKSLFRPRRTLPTAEFLLLPPPLPSVRLSSPCRRLQKMKPAAPACIILQRQFLHNSPRRVMPGKGRQVRCRTGWMNGTHSRFHCRGRCPHRPAPGWFYLHGLVEWKMLFIIPFPPSHSTYQVGSVRLRDDVGIVPYIRVGARSDQ